MNADYTHILAVTVKLLTIDGTPAAPHYKGMMYAYSSYLNTTEPDSNTIDQRVKQVFYYRDILLCLVDLDDTFSDMDTAAKTTALEPLVNSLFKSDGLVYFNWMLQSKEDVENRTLPIIQEIEGSSGGSNIGNR